MCLPWICSILNLLVEANQDESKDSAADNGDAKHARDNTIAATVAVLWEVPNVGARDISKLAESVDECQGHSSLRRWARKG